MLDLVGPWEVLARIPDAKTHLVWTRPGPVVADGGMEVATTIGFDDCPQFEVLLVPGDPGQQMLMRHQLLMDFLRRQAERYVFDGKLVTAAGVSAGIDLAQAPGPIVERMVAARPQYT